MWLPLAYTSACVALTGFGEEVNNAMKANPSAADIDATFKVRSCVKFNVLHCMHCGQSGEHHNGLVVV